MDGKNRRYIQSVNLFWIKFLKITEWNLLEWHQLNINEKNTGRIEKSHRTDYMTKFLCVRVWLGSQNSTDLLTRGRLQILREIIQKSLQESFMYCVITKHWLAISQRSPQREMKNIHRRSLAKFSCFLVEFNVRN